MKLIVGLGNPGYEYHLTPHNLGFMAVDRLAQECGVEISRREAQALVAPATLEQEDVLLAKPQTFMNLSGLAVAKLLAKYELEPADLLVLVDDVNLPLGTLRIRRRGSAGGHKGLMSIIGALQADEFVRLRLGVGSVGPLEEVTAYVLAPFSSADLEKVAEMLDRAHEAVRAILKEGVAKAMNRFNRRVASPAM